MKRMGFVGTGILAIGALTGAVWAAEPSKADMDVCNQKAAQVTSSGQPKSGTTPPSTSQSTNPTGGRATDSSQPGISPSQLGMAPIGETNPAYKQAYLACINDRTK
jgi:hypothetical protein